ncbi:TIR domain-containing protein [uncultured Maritimibacter sp.]|uniref:TIR domain-containing protein n=1 Tax=uncultured Maritimibacter sp. TaxID=991866 RepID=UPI00259308A7|nr:TIR domain-containing protein [uncultured Maritimibacter sp.]
MYEFGVFISHSWAYSNHYEKLCEWIFEQTWNAPNGLPIRFVNFSVPSDDPIHGARNDAELEAAILRKMLHAHVLICPTGMYSSHSKWIGKEIKGARAYHLRILAVDPWGQERKSSIVSQAADHTVGWTSASVVQGIWDLANE